MPEHTVRTLAAAEEAEPSHSHEIEIDIDFSNIEAVESKKSMSPPILIKDDLSRNVGWVRAGVLMMKTQVGIGVLSIPGAFNSLGLVPGVIVLLIISAMTTWSDCEIGRFKLRHTTAYGLDDAGDLMFGPVGRELFMAASMLYWIFVAGSAFVSVSTALNALSNHGACTAAFIAMAAIGGFILSSIPTLKKISWAAWVGMACILTAVFIVTIATGIQDRPAAAPATGPWTSDYKLVGDATFAQAMSAVASIIFAFSGTPAFFAIISEMSKPEHCYRSIALCQSVVTTVYLTIGIVVYYYCGSFVSSPARGSAGNAVKKVSYGMALPGLLVTTMIVCHIPAKTFFMRIRRGPGDPKTKSLTWWVTWLGCTLSVVILGYIIASAVPAFSALVSLIGAFFGTFISMQPYGAMWLYDNWKPDMSSPRGWRWMAGVCWAGFIIVGGFFCMAGGSYGAIVDIVDIYRQSGTSAAWSCADNSGSS